MVKYKLHEVRDGLRFYRYFPEGNGKPGTISINLSDGSTTIVELSSDDFGKRYAFKLLSHLRRFHEEGHFKDEGIIAWY